MPEKRDYYEVLQVERSASPDQIKRAYRKAALKYHPDNFNGDKTEGERLFKECSEAYEVLSDPAKRQQYDRFGHQGLRGAGMHDFSSMGFGDIFSMFEDIFGGMGGFGGARSRRGGAPRGLDLETEIELTLDEVASGVDRSLEFERMDFCDACGGSGARPGTTPDTCATCGGYGQVQQQVQSFFGVSMRITACPQCHGKGATVSDPCERCGGSGRRKKKRTLTVHVPPGVHEGQRVRLRGEGEPGPAGNAKGDLHVYIRVKDHPLLQRRGDDLLCQVPISFTQAALGATVDVPTLEGMEEVEIPAGTQHGDVIHLKRRGLPSARTGRQGSQYVQVFVEIPRKLTDHQRELLAEFAELEDKNVSPQRKSWFERLKECFGAA